MPDNSQQPQNIGPSDESLKALDAFKKRMDEINDQIIDMGNELGDSLVKKLTKAAFEAKNITNPLKEVESLSKKVADLAEETAILYNQESISSRNFAKLGQENNILLQQIAEETGDIEKKILETKLKQNREEQQTLSSKLAQVRSNIDLNQQLMSEFQTLKEVGDIEKKILETKQKQVNVVDQIKKKFADQLKSLKDMFSLGSLIDMLFKGSENIANFRKELGISYSNAYALNNQIGFIGNNIFDAYINGEKLKKAFTDLSKEMGFIADYGGQSLVTMTNLTGRLGMSNKEAAQLTTLSRMQSKDTEGVLNNVGKTVNAMNAQGKTSILLKDVLRDVANVSKAIAVSLGSNPVKIAEAVVAAKQLGTTLQQLESTADALLNFESSIGDELKAELLTGKQMNLERARAAALANDMKGLSEEIGKNEEVLSAFASNNRLAQEATAKALGMNREQLAAMIYQQEAMKIGAEGVRAKYGEQAYEQLKAQSAQEKFNNSIEKLKTALSSVVQIFSPIIDLLAMVSETIANILSQWYIFYPLVGLVALSYLPKMLSSFTGIGASLKGIGTNFTNLFSKEGRASLMGGTDKAKEAATSAAGAGDKAGAGGPKAGEGIKNTLKGISAGISSFDKVKASDILKVAGSALALVALTPAVPALLLLQFVNGKAIQSALTGIGQGFNAIGSALRDPRVILGLGVATLAIMGIGKALGFAAPAIKAIGEAVGSVITSIATGVSTVVKSLGDMIAKLGEAGPALLLLGPALIGIAGGLAAMGFSGILALPTIIALTALGAVAPALAAIGIGGGEKEKENINTGIDLTPMINTINEVKASVDRLYNKDTSINMDSKKVGSTLVQGSYKVA
jgi:hypothetical protein